MRSRRRGPAGEVVSPPAGAIGRGDAFLLRIADKVNAVVLSNDSFQEFHGDYEWLFDDRRLIGGMPVPGIGWIFTPRSPVRGPTSRVAVQKAKKAKKAADAPRDGQEGGQGRHRCRDRGGGEARAQAPRRGRRRSSGAPPSEPVNEPLAFIDFVGQHPLGSQVEGEVEEFTSHGAFVQIDGVRCYLPLTGMGDPPPRSARSFLTKGETRGLHRSRRSTRRAAASRSPCRPFAHVAGAPTRRDRRGRDRRGPERPRRRPSPRRRPPRRPRRPRRLPGQEGPEDQGGRPEPEPKKAAKKKAAAKPAKAAPAKAEPAEPPVKKKAARTAAAARADAGPPKPKKAATKKASKKVGDSYRRVVSTALR